ncbi:bifunctional diguanylate cyclase/phosphodiesterase [Ideonella sp. A 288]|uniref:putative bifunctional diguanylate cyclase/phosphodiesterase n=1 Tax=Ideonella sp. A 288 TaxID=1962181 RepID=UPI00130368D3|nr:GGDEF and EAL domain-containing protein [Ideonella sp. A 288]
MMSKPLTVDARATSLWQAFARRVLFDYPPRARAAWLAITGAGAAALGWASWNLVSMSKTEAWSLALALGLVALASSLSIKLPRSEYSLSIGDVFVFGVLATLGPAAAVLASGTDALAGTVRYNKRLSTRLATTAAALAAMAVCAWAFEVVKAALARYGLGAESATMAALALVALLPFALSLLPLMSMTALRYDQPQAPLRWLADASWMAAIYVASALIAGLVHLQAQRFGATTLVVTALSAIVILLLLRSAVQRQESERLRQEAQLAQAQHEATLSHQRFAAAFSHAAIGMVIVKPDGHILQANDALVALLKLEPGAVLGLPFEQLLDAPDAPLMRRRAQAARVSQDDAFSMEMQVRRGDGQDIWVAVHCSQYEDPDGGGQCLIYQLHDITSRHVAESRLNHIAYHDDLTGLANRHCFHEMLEAAVERARLDPGQRFAVLYLDLDRFKLVNDSLGHGAGNELLREVAARLRASVHPFNLVARLGGDEFAALVETVGEPEITLQLAHRVLDELSRPTHLLGTEVIPGVSVGVTFSDLGDRTAEEIMRDADLAMYEAKAAGRGRVVRFDRSMHRKVAEKLSLETDLRRAIGDGQLSVHFQPIYQLEPYRLSGFEALARWVHPQRGAISPAVFIALAEESGHIEALTDWIIDHAMAQLARWKRDSPGRQHLCMHVNICGRDLARVSLAPHVEQVLQRHQAVPGSLTLELTETMLMGRLDVALRTMASLRASGVRFSIDDFGTGYSSLSYLGRLPIDSLKIDRSFVMAMHESRENLEIVRAMLTLGRTLGHKVIAEGIETEDQLAMLRQLGVHEGQGYLLSHPLCADRVDDLLAAAESTADHADSGPRA